jgi:hypothetical protein
MEGPRGAFCAGDSGGASGGNVSVVYVWTIISSMPDIFIIKVIII